MRVNRKFTLNKELGSTGSMTVELELEVKYERWYSSNTLMLSGGAFFFTFSCVCYSVTSSSWMSFKRILDREGIRSEGKSCTYIDIQRSRKLGSHINAQITILAPAPLDPCHARQQIIHSLILYTLSLSHMCSKSVYVCMYIVCIIKCPYRDSHWQNFTIDTVHTIRKQCVIIRITEYFWFQRSYNIQRHKSNCGI